MVLVLYSRTIQFSAKRDLKLTRLSALISLNLTKFMKYNKLNTEYSHQIVSSFNLMIEYIRVNSRCNTYSMNLTDNLREKQYTQHLLIMRTAQIEYSFDGHPSTLNMLVKATFLLVSYKNFVGWDSLTIKLPDILLLFSLSQCPLFSQTRL